MTTLLRDDGFGNITNKGGNPYSYHPNTHRVSAAHGNNYFYDLNGNVHSISGASPATLSYTAFNLPSQIQRSGNTLAYTYDGDHQRVKEVASGGLNRTTFYVLAGSHPFFEKEIQGPQTRWRHYLNTPEGTKALIIIGGPTPTDRVERYLHHDHLGSVIAVTEGVSIERRVFDAWGLRTSGGFALSDRGFTGHEHLDEVGLIHMNGRIYDPILGRFLQADPIIQSPFDLQSFNRYSYVLNNPLAYIDPTGFSFWTKWRRAIVAVVVSVVTYGIVSGWVMSAYGVTAGAAAAEGISMAAMAAATPTGIAGLSVGTVAGIAGGAAAGFAAGGIMGGNLQSALHGAVTGGISGGVAGYFGDTYSLGRVATESVVGGVNARIQGGSFREGLRMGFAFSAATYIAVSMRETMWHQSQLDPRNAGGESVGHRGIGGKVGGNRFDPDLYEHLVSRLGEIEGAQLYWTELGSELGWHQGKPGRFFGAPYPAGSLRDKLVEAYSGVHDFFNWPGLYDSSTGNIRRGMPVGGWERFFYGLVVNYVNVPLSTPLVAASAIPEHARSIVFGPRRR